MSAVPPPVSRDEEPRLYPTMEQVLASMLVSAAARTGDARAAALAFVPLTTMICKVPSLVLCYTLSPDTISL